MRKRTLGAAIATIALLAPATGAQAATTVRGVVLKKDAQTRQLVIAGKTGRVDRVRVRSLAAFRVGQTVKVTGRVTATGIVASKVTKLGKAKRATVRGVVVRGKRSYMLVASRGAVLRIAVGKRRAAGSAVKAKVVLRNGQLEAEKVEIEDASADEFEAKGTVTAIDTTAGTITFNLKEDDSVVTILIGTADVTGLTAGSVVEIEAAISKDEAGNTVYTLVKWHAEDCDEDHGDDAGDQGEVEVDGVLKSFDATSVVVTVAGQDITFAAGTVDLTGFAVGDTVEAKGYVIAEVLTLVRIEHEDDMNDEDEGDDDNGVGSSNDDGMDNTGGGTEPGNDSGGGSGGGGSGGGGGTNG